MNQKSQLERITKKQEKAMREIMTLASASGIHIIATTLEDLTLQMSETLVEKIDSDTSGNMLKRLESVAENIHEQLADYYETTVNEYITTFETEAEEDALEDEDEEGNEVEE